MTTHSALYVGDNTHVVEVFELTDHLGVPQTTATVELTALVDKYTGVTVTGVTMPLSMPYVLLDALYRATIPHAVGSAVVAGRTYLATIKAVGAQGFRAEWVESLVAKVRAA